MGGIPAAERGNDGDFPTEMAEVARGCDGDYSR